MELGPYFPALSTAPPPPALALDPVSVCFLLSFLKLNYLPCNSAIDIVAGLWIFIEMKWLYYSWWTRTSEDICLLLFGYPHIFLWSPGGSNLAWASSVPRGQWLGLKGRTESKERNHCFLREILLQSFSNAPTKPVYRQCSSLFLRSEAESQKN